MSRLPRIAELAADAVGVGFYLCARKDVRTSKAGEAFLSMELHDVSGRIPGKMFGADVERYREEFGAGEFVKIEGRANLYNGRLELIVNRIRRVNPEQDAQHGFREEECIPCAPRAIDEMWQELSAQIAAVQDPGVRVLLARIAGDNAERLRTWPAAVTVHHAYKGGLLEHVLQVARVGRAIADAYGADADLVFAGAVLHDIGKLREFDYDLSTSYSREGNLVGHIALGLMMVREAAAGLAALTDERRTEVEHLVASHHGSRELGSPVEPMSVEAFILSMVDDLDAKLHQVRRHMAEDDGDGEFTTYHSRLKRVLLKPRA